MEDNTKYNVIVSPAAEADIDDVYNYITLEAMSPETAIQYYFGIYDTIKRLSVVGAVLPVSQRPSLRKRYGTDVRTVNYKKMTIIYNIAGNVICVQRVMASSLIR
jgi:plasmid stabilization system protein ParE